MHPPEADDPATHFDPHQNRHCHISHVAALACQESERATASHGCLLMPYSRPNRNVPSQAGAPWIPQLQIRNQPSTIKLIQPPFTVSISMLIETSCPIPEIASAVLLNIRLKSRRFNGSVVTIHFR